jgi:hypothetical protein
VIVTPLTLDNETSFSFSVEAIIFLIKMKLSVAFFLLGASQTAGFAFRPMSARSSSSLSAKKKIFIDGEAGTTGLQVRSRLEARDDLEIISPPSELRKDEATRKDFINQADCVILCKSLCSRLYLLEIVSLWTTLLH